MLASILHRVTGDGFAFIGLPVLLWWLGALASGPEAYETFTAVATSVPGYIVLVGLSWAFFGHLCSGLRHFALDMGAGFDVDANNRWAVITVVAGVVLTAAFWAALLLL
jgi:succinate dehydrogenase / fumarate reductase cytochrome b subunit